jgi:hypothetical protein
MGPEVGVRGGGRAAAGEGFAAAVVLILGWSATARGQQPGAGAAATGGRGADDRGGAPDRRRQPTSQAPAAPARGDSDGRDRGGRAVLSRRTLRRRRGSGQDGPQQERTLHPRHARDGQGLLQARQDRVDPQAVGDDAGQWRFRRREVRDLPDARLPRGPAAKRAGCHRALQEGGGRQAGQRHHLEQPRCAVLWWPRTTRRPLPCSSGPLSSSRASRRRSSTWAAPTAASRNTSGPRPPISTRYRSFRITPTRSSTWGSSISTPTRCPTSTPSRGSIPPSRTFRSTSR